MFSSFLHPPTLLSFPFSFPSLYLTLSLLPLFPSLFSSSLFPHPPLFSPASCKITLYHLCVCLCMYRSQCVRPCWGECMCEWPCECACATLTRRGAVKEQERENERRGDEKEGDWIWPCGWCFGIGTVADLRESVCDGSVPVRVCVRWDLLWAEDKLLRERKKNLKKAGRPDSIVRYPNCSHHLFNLI